MLAQKHHQVTVFVNDDSVSGIKEQLQEGIKIIRFNPSAANSSSFLGHTTNISYEFAAIIKKYIESEGKPDLIESQEYLGIAYYLLQYKKLRYSWCADIPVLITMHSPSFLYLEYNHVPGYKYPNYWIGEMERFSIKAADILISPSNFLLEQVKQRFEFKQPGSFILFNPFLIDGSNNALKSGAEEEVVFFGKLSNQKGVFHLLQYFKILWKNGSSLALYLIGGQDIVYHPEGRQMGELIKSRYKQFIQQGLLKLEDKIPPAQIKDRMCRVKIVIIPSTVDNLPYIVLEMMALGKIVLVSKQGGQAEIVTDGIDGFIFDHEEEGSFFHQLERIMKLNQDEVIRIKKNAVRRIKEDFNQDVIYEQKIEIIDNYFGQKKPDNKPFPFLRASITSNGRINAPVQIGLLSIIIPYYNLGKYLPETINSLRSSDYKEFEILIINDGSNEELSIKALNEYRHDKDIRVIDIENRGLANARNIGAENARGEYLAFLDADDKIATSSYSKAIHVLSYYENVHFVGAWVQYFEGSSKIWPTFTPEPPLILFHNLVNSSGLVYKRNSFLTAGKNDNNMIFAGLEDHESVISMVEQGYNGVVLPEPLFYYRVRPNSMIRGVTRSKKLYLYQQISTKHKEIYAKFATDLFNLGTANGPGILLDNPSLDFDLADKLPLGRNFSKKLIPVIKRNKHIRRIAYKIYKTFNR
jgi:glycosyltransferase involved in cell wall biosynthesis